MTGKYQPVTKKANAKEKPKGSGPVLLSCPHCSASLSLRASGYSVTIVCNSCGAIIDLGDDNPTVTAILEKPSSKNQYIPLGARGKLHGTLWEVIGFLERFNFLSKETWHEYLIFNPYKGFRWLTEWQGHWNYVYSLHSIPVIKEKVSARYLNRDYEFLTSYTASIRHVAGEFYWRVKSGDTARILEYVNTPEILNQEHADEDIIWSLAEYIEPEDVKKAFQSSIKSFPSQTGIAVNQPSSTKHYVRPLLKTCGLALLGLLTLSIVFAYLSPSTQVLKTQFTLPKATSIQYEEREFVSPSFDIDTQHGVLTLQVESPLNNAWLELETSLVNDNTGDTVSLMTGLEYYSGFDYEDNMHWSEGSKSEKIAISAPPKGRYHLDIHAKTNASLEELPIKITVIEGVHSGANFFLAFFLILSVPFFVLLNEIFFSMRKKSDTEDWKWTDWFNDD